MDVTSNWYATAFDTLYPVLYAHRNVESAKAEAAFAVEKLALTRADSILDLCCGTGRHMVHLEKSCPRVLGLDYSETLLGIGANALGLSGRLVRGDMRSLPFADASFDALMNFFTSFGYFESANDNRKVLSEIARTLKPGACFMLDYLNVNHVRDNLVPESERFAGQYRILEKRWIDGEAGRVNKRTSVYEGSGLYMEISESVQLYAREELMVMLADAGLKAGFFYGDFDGAAADADSPRLIITGRKE